MNNEQGPVGFYPGPLSKGGHLKGPFWLFELFRFVLILGVIF